MVGENFATMIFITEEYNNVNIHQWDCRTTGSLPAPQFNESFCLFVCMFVCVFVWSLTSNSRKI